MNSSRAKTFIAAAALLVSAAQAQISGSVSYSGCTSLIPDNRGAGGELYAMKTQNAGGGPDEHQDWAFDLSGKGGGVVTGTDAGGPVWTVDDNFHRNTVPPQEEFFLMTYPGGYLAVDSLSLRGGPETAGVVMRQKVGDSLAVGVDAGIGLVLPGDASPYTVGIIDRRSGRLAQFPYGTATGISVAFAPVAEINTTEIGGTGCTIGGAILDEGAGFGSIVGYNVFRVAGIPGRVPTTSEFMGSWQYYIPFDSFDLGIADTAGTSGPDMNGDGLPDGDGMSAPNDSLPFDLVGLHNPDGRAYSGDEVIIFQDSALNPDGTPRPSGTGPNLSGGGGYWYAFQPVIFSGPTTIADYDGLGFSRADEFLGTHALDTDGDGIFESLDMDLDGTAEFYSPQAAIGITGLGLTNGGLALLSAPVFGRANAAIALGEPRLQTSIAGNQVELKMFAGLETGMVIGYEITRTVGGRTTPVTLSLMPARGGEGNVYTLVDRLPNLRNPAPISYTVERVLTHSFVQEFGPFVLDTTQVVPNRRRR